MNESKRTLTEQITDWLQIEIDKSGDDSVKSVFGQPGTKNTDYFYQADSLRLRSAGYKLLRIYFDCEKFNLGREFRVGEILTLSKNMNAPFYIAGPHIVLFSHENIVMCKLAGDVTSWLNNFS